MTTANRIPGPLPLPPQSALFRAARGHVGSAHRELGDALEWLLGDWDPAERALPAPAAAARSTAGRKITAARALLDEAAAAIDRANEYYRAQRQAPAERSEARR